MEMEFKKFSEESYRLSLAFFSHFFKENDQKLNKFSLLFDWKKVDAVFDTWKNKIINTDCSVKISWTIGNLNQMNFHVISPNKTMEFKKTFFLKKSESEGE